MDFELVIANGTIVDGTGRSRFRADLGLEGGRIAAIATNQPLTGRETLDAAGLIVAPGFIDVHSHGDWILPLPDHDEILAPLSAPFPASSGATAAPWGSFHSRRRFGA